MTATGMHKATWLSGLNNVERGLGKEFYVSIAARAAAMGMPPHLNPAMMNGASAGTLPGLAMPPLGMGPMAMASALPLAGALPCPTWLHLTLTTALMLVFWSVVRTD